MAGVLAGVIASAAQANAAAASPEPRFRHQAPVIVEQSAAFVRLPLPVAAYAASRQPGLADLRLVDARGERVPFAMLLPRPGEARASESAQPVALYALPAPRPGERDLANPIEVQVVGDRITVKRLDRSASTAARGAAVAVPGWLFDLGELPDRSRDSFHDRSRDSSVTSPRAEPPPAWLRLSWATPAEFVAAFDLEVSADLRQWRRVAGGQLLELPSPTNRLTQRDVPLPADASRPRFVRLRWADPATAPKLLAAEQVWLRRSSVVLDSPTALRLEPLPAAMAQTGSAPTGKAALAHDEPPALHYDLGAVLPVVEIDLPLAAAHRVAPVRVQGRSRDDEPWRDLAQTVFYRIERGGTVDRPPPLALAAQVRWLRLVPDARSGPLPATPLVVQAQLASLVFAPQGAAPFKLLAGSSDAPVGALPLATLVPALDTERARFGRATLGAFVQDEALAREEAWRQRVASMRPLVLWAVLLLGVAGLGAMVWKLARGGRSGPSDLPGAPGGAVGQ